MPFLYELSLPADASEYEFVQQLVPNGTLVGTGQAVATLTDGRMEYHLLAPLQGLLVEWTRQHPDEVEGGEAVARIVAEGESRPVAAAELRRLG